jgi:hypothetical protein
MPRAGRWPRRARRSESVARIADVGAGDDERAGCVRAGTGLSAKAAMQARRARTGGSVVNFGLLT